MTQKSHTSSTELYRKSLILDVPIYIVSGLALLTIFDALNVVNLGVSAWLAIGVCSLLTLIFTLCSLKEEYKRDPENIWAILGVRASELGGRLSGYEEKKSFVVNNQDTALQNIYSNSRTYDRCEGKMAAF